MAIIVEHKTYYERYILLGAGLGLYKALSPSILGGNLFPYEDEGEVQSLAVCNYLGEITFVESNKLRVVEVDGTEIGELKDKLAISKIAAGKPSEWNDDESGYNICPGCNEQINPRVIECPSCGLRLR